MHKNYQVTKHSFIIIFIQILFINKTSYYNYLNIIIDKYLLIY